MYYTHTPETPRKPASVKSLLKFPVSLLTRTVVIFRREIACSQAHLRIFSSKKAKTSGSQMLTPW